MHVGSIAVVCEPLDAAVGSSSLARARTQAPCIRTWSLTHWNTSACSVAKLHLTLCTPVDCGPQASLSP